MKENDYAEIADTIFKNVFNKKNNYTLEELENYFAKRIHLPVLVKDYMTGEDTWTKEDIFQKYIISCNQFKIENWMKEKVFIQDIEELLNRWKEINIVSTERVNNSTHVCKSDAIMNCQNVYRSLSCSNSNNILLSCNCNNSNYLLASMGADDCSFCMNIFDSSNCSNSFHVSWSNKVAESMFIQDCYNIYECIFCAHIGNKRYCIGNMQFEKEEYYKLKEDIIQMLLQNPSEIL